MIEKHKNLKTINTFGIEVYAKTYTSFDSVETLREILNENQNEKLLILGGGSNILFTKDVDALVLKNNIKGFEIMQEDEDHVIVKSGAGEIWHEFVLKTIEQNWSGIENLSLIPGSVGASPMQNIGAYGVEIKDVFHSLEAFHIKTGELHTFNKEACEFGYRESVFKRALKEQYVIVSVSFQLNKTHQLNTSYGVINDELKSMGIENPTIKDVSNAVIAIRSSKLPNPKEIGNAGSFFKNPVVAQQVLDKIKLDFSDVPNYPAPNGDVKLAAGWLIEKAGWKGFTNHNFGVHKNQALVLVNYGGATGKEIYDLSTQIIENIKNKFGVELEREVNIL